MQTWFLLDNNNNIIDKCYASSLRAALDIFTAREWYYISDIVSEVEYGLFINQTN